MDALSVHQTTQATNFLSTVQGGVDPRTGLFNLNLPVAQLVGNDQQGPTLAVTLAYSPLNTVNHGYGIGFSLGHSYYDTDNHLLVLASGERYRISETGDQPVVEQQKLSHFKFVKTTSAYKIIWKSGEVEVLAGPDTADDIKMPQALYSPLGHALTLTWDEKVNPPRLKQVQDAQHTLLKVTYDSDDPVFHVWPDHKEAYTIALTLTNDRVTAITNKALGTDLTWTLGYNDAITGVSPLDQLTHPTGLSETVTYNAAEMVMPVQNGTNTLPAVIRYVRTPGAGQPALTTTYKYSNNNYLGNGNGTSWTQETVTDPLYGTLTSYTYWSMETAETGNADTAIVTTRYYNAFHLLTKEEVACGQCLQTTETDYYMTAGLLFEQQPAQYQLPKTSTVTWKDARKPEGKQTRTEITSTTFDTAGNPLTHTDPDGTQTIYDYYPVAGETDTVSKAVLCPPEPNGFVRLLKSATVTAPTVSIGETKFEVPVRKTVYTYQSFPLRTGAAEATGITSAVLKSGETQFNDSTKLSAIVHEYTNAPALAEHGRPKCDTSTIYENAMTTYTHQQSLTFTAEDEVLTQSITSSTHDNLSFTTQRSHSRFSGRLQSATDAQNNTVQYSYDALGRIKTETLHPKDTTYTNTKTYSYTQLTTGSPALFTTVTDALGNQHKTGFDGLGRPVQQWVLDLDGAKDSQGNHQWYLVATRTYDALGRISSSTGYDWLETTTTPTAASIQVTTQTSYDNWGQPTQVTTSDGLTHLSQHDPIANTTTSYLTGKDNAYSAKQVTQYNLHGQPTQVDQYRYDTSTKQYVATAYNTSKMAYDGLQRLRKSTDTLDYTTQYAYDDWDRVIATTLPDSTITKKTYAPFTASNLVTGIQINDQALSDKYFNDFALGTQSFDGLARLKQTINGDRISTYEYKNANINRPYQITAPDSTVTKYEYIPQLGDVVKERTVQKSTSTAVDITQTFDYNTLTGALKSASAQPNSLSQSLSYFPSGALKTETFKQPTEKGTAYSYSLNGVVRSYTDVCGQQQIYYYDATGLPKELDDPAVTITFGYDNLNRLTSWAAKDKISKNSLTTTLTLDEFGRETQRVLSSSKGESWTITQDYYINHQLKQRTIKTGTGTTQTLRRQEDFVYDNRNRLKTYTCNKDAYDAPVAPLG